jgi:cellulose synthase A
LCWLLLATRTFARFGEQGRFLVSGGNDGFIKLWDWALEESPPSANALSVSCKQRSPLLLNIDHKRKVSKYLHWIPDSFRRVGFIFHLHVVTISNQSMYDSNNVVYHLLQVNWLSTTSTASENLVVADTSKIVSVYSVL